MRDAEQVIIVELIRRGLMPEEKNTLIIPVSEGYMKAIWLISSLGQ